MIRTSDEGASIVCKTQSNPQREISPWVLPEVMPPPCAAEEHTLFLYVAIILGVPIASFCVRMSKFPKFQQAT